MAIRIQRLSHSVGNTLSKKRITLVTLWSEKSTNGGQSI
ncbi:Uncharacterised protein [Vibrio cholerae]|nr:Uncharacterised protein [Vibrio cholerae]